MSLSHIRQLEARGHWGIKKGLENIRALLEALDHPEKAFPSLLIAGTNGKGSTGAFLAQALRACSLRVGWTTSPHLLDPNERIWVDGGPVSMASLDEALGAALAAEATLGIQATYFELMIAAALWTFRKQGVEVALVEVGMGGRWDSTNALDPLLTVLTTVGLDHMLHLGNTREAIGREKLCTAREGRPLVLGPTVEPAWVEPLLECRPFLCPAALLEAESVAWDHSIVSGSRIQLAGRHQIENLSTAREALRQLRNLGWNLPEQRVDEGLSQATWPGRLWKVPGLREVWMDGAHNPDGARVLADHAQACGVHPQVFFGAMGDKDLEGVVAELRRMQPTRLTLVKGLNERYASAEALRQAWGDPGLPILDLSQAAARLREEESQPRLVTGSLLLLGDLLRILGIQPWKAPHR